MQEFHYKVRWRSRGAHSGFHASTHTGGGFEFRGHAPLIVGRDPRRLDLRASVRDPFEQLHVRVFHQKTAIPVYAIADLSASMSFGRKPTILADFVSACAYSVHRTGDTFAFIGCDHRVRRDFYLPPTRARAAGQVLADGLRQLEQWGRNSAALAEATRFFDERRALTFLISDFHFPAPLLAAVLAGFARHTVVPVVIRDSSEQHELPLFGVLRLRDSETEATRTVFARPALNRRIRAAAEERERNLKLLAGRLASPPLYLVDRLRVDAVTEYFQGMP